MKGYILTTQMMQVGQQQIPIATGTQAVDCQLMPSDPSLLGTVTVYESQADADAAVVAAQSDIRGHVEALSEKLSAPPTATDATAVGVRDSLKVPSDTPPAPVEAATSEAEPPVSPPVAEASEPSGTASVAADEDEDSGPAVDSDDDGKVGVGDLVVGPDHKRGRVITVTEDQVEVAYKSGKTATFPLSELSTATKK